MLTDTQWLLSALVAEIQAAGIADTVETFNGVDLEEAIRQLHAYPSTAVIVMPDLLTMDHDIQGRVPVKAIITRKVNLFVASAAYGRTGGDMATANAMVDKVLELLTWHELGQSGRVLVKPVAATPQQIAFDSTPCRAVWSMQVDVTCLENSF